MPDSLRDAWKSHITTEDYERHMAATGQPQANGDLLTEFFRERPPAAGAVLLAGAGTGQVFDYFPGAALAGYRVTCTDINPAYLERLKARFPCTAAVDDVECPALRGPFDLAIVILVLEHVAWKRAVAGLCTISARVLAIIQEDPEGWISPRPSGTMAVLDELPPHLVNPGELTGEFEECGFELTWKSAREARDGKKMTALEFRRR